MQADSPLLTVHTFSSFFFLSQSKVLYTRAFGVVCSQFEDSLVCSVSVKVFSQRKPAFHQCCGSVVQSQIIQQLHLNMQQYAEIGLVSLKSQCIENNMQKVLAYYTISGGFKKKKKSVHLCMLYGLVSHYIFYLNKMVRDVRLKLQ